MVDAAHSVLRWKRANERTRPFTRTRKAPLLATAREDLESRGAQDWRTRVDVIAFRGAVMDLEYGAMSALLSRMRQRLLNDDVLAAPAASTDRASA